MLLAPGKFQQAHQRSLHHLPKQVSFVHTGASCVIVPSKPANTLILRFVLKFEVTCCVGVEDMEDVKVDPRAKPWCDIGGLFGHAVAI